MHCTKIKAIKNIGDPVTAITLIIANTAHSITHIRRSDTENLRNDIYTTRKTAIAVTMDIMRYS